jgi:hypothetical protein
MTESNAFELVKDYLKHNGYTSTLECFTKEHSYKNLGLDKQPKVLIL